jgi:hypothetical protein
VTKVAIDLSKISEITKSIDQLSAHLIAEMKSEAPPLWNAQITTRDQERHNRPDSKFDLHLWDIRSLVSELSMQTNNENTKSLCESIVEVMKPGGAILDEIHLGDWFKNIGGLSIYLPMPKEVPGVTAYYPDLQFGSKTCWYEMLMKYHLAGKKHRTRLP